MNSSPKDAQVVFFKICGELFYDEEDLVRATDTSLTVPSLRLGVLLGSKALLPSD